MIFGVEMNEKWILEDDEQMGTNMNKEHGLMVKQVDCMAF
jgi:hypothetical protein